VNLLSLVSRDGTTGLPCVLMNNTAHGF